MDANVQCTLVPFRTNVLPYRIVITNPLVDILENTSVNGGVLSLLELALDVLACRPFFEMEPNLQRQI